MANRIPDQQVGVPHGGNDAPKPNDLASVEVPVLPQSGGTKIISVTEVEVPQLAKSMNPALQNAEKHVRVVEEVYYEAVTKRGFGAIRKERCIPISQARSEGIPLPEGI